MSLTMNEQILLLTIYRLGSAAHGVEIQEAVTSLTGKEAAFGTLYNNMDQLIRKGYAEANKGEPTSVRGGKAKIYYTITPGGIRALEESRLLQQKLWKGISSLASQKK